MKGKRMSKLRSTVQALPQSAEVLVFNMGAILKTLRILHGRTLRELGAATNIDPAYIYRIEQGIMANPSKEKLEALLQSLTNGPWLYK